MNIHLEGDLLTIQNANSAEYERIKQWNLTRWNRKNKQTEGPANLELLDKLADLTSLSPEVEAQRQKLRALQDAVDCERVAPSPVPLYSYPVKLPLYTHQIRGANMALLTFGWV